MMMLMESPKILEKQKLKKYFIDIIQIYRNSNFCNAVVILFSLKLPYFINDLKSKEFNNLGRIDCDYSPKINFGHTLLNILTFGFYKKQYIKSKRETYFLGEINQRKKLFLHTKHQLKDT